MPVVDGGVVDAPPPDAAPDAVASDTGSPDAATVARACAAEAIDVLPDAWIVSARIVPREGGAWVVASEHVRATDTAPARSRIRVVSLDESGAPASDPIVVVDREREEGEWRGDLLAGEPLVDGRGLAFASASTTSVWLHRVSDGVVTSVDLEVDEEIDRVHGPFATSGGDVVVTGTAPVTLTAVGGGHVARTETIYLYGEEPVVQAPDGRLLLVDGQGYWVRDDLTIDERAPVALSSGGTGPIAWDEARGGIASIGHWDDPRDPSTWIDWIGVDAPSPRARWSLPELAVPAHARAPSGDPAFFFEIAVRGETTFGARVGAFVLDDPDAPPRTLVRTAPRFVTFEEFALGARIAGTVGLEDGSERGRWLVLLPFARADGSLGLEIHCRPDAELEVYEPAPPATTSPTCEDAVELVDPARLDATGDYVAYVSPGADPYLGETCSDFGSGRHGAVRITADRAGTWTLSASGHQLWALDVRRTCEDATTRLACDPLLDFHSADPFATPREVRVRLEAGETVFAVLGACPSSETCGWRVVASPPPEGPPCVATADCAAGAVCDLEAGVCVTATAPTVARAVAFRHPDDVLAVRLEGEDTTRDVVTIGARLFDSGGAPTGAVIVPAEGELGSVAFDAHARWTDDSGVARHASAELRVGDATGMSSATMLVPVTDAPVRAIGEPCDPDIIEDRCDVGLTCTASVCR